MLCNLPTKDLLSFTGYEFVLVTGFMQEMLLINCMLLKTASTNFSRSLVYIYTLASQGITTIVHLLLVPIEATIQSARKIVSWERVTLHLAPCTLMFIYSPLRTWRLTGVVAGTHWPGLSVVVRTARESTACSMTSRRLSVDLETTPSRCSTSNTC